MKKRQFCGFFADFLLIFCTQHLLKSIGFPRISAALLLSTVAEGKGGKSGSSVRNWKPRLTEKKLVFFFVFFGGSFFFCG